MAWFGSHQDAVGQALADTRAVLAGGISLRDPIALSVRLGDLSRSNGLLSLEASLQSLEQYSRLIRIGQRSTRSLALATLAADILGVLHVDTIEQRCFTESDIHQWISPARPAGTPLGTSHAAAGLGVAA